MRTAARLAAFGGGLVVIFAVAAVESRAIVPTSVADSWIRAADRPVEHSAGDPMGHGGSTDHSAGHSAMPPQGVSLERDGYRLGELEAPDRIGRNGTLSFRVVDRHGAAVTAYTPEHTKDLHLIVVRSDGSDFRHVHPTLDDTGTWSVPWRWTTAGSYRVYADFTPAAATTGVTLARSVEVGGSYAPAASSRVSRTSSVDGFEVTVSGDLRAGADSHLTTTITRDGHPVTKLQPYLGAFGHLVILRQGDLAYLHVHPEGREPAAGASSGPDIGFMADVPTPGRYFLYLDFRVDGEVHTATFVLDAH